MYEQALTDASWRVLSARATNSVISSFTPLCLPVNSVSTYCVHSSWPCHV